MIHGSNTWTHKPLIVLNIVSKVSEKITVSRIKEKKSILNISVGNIYSLKVFTWSRKMRHTAHIKL